MTGRRARAALGLVVALLLAGCGGLSRSGPVQSGLDVGSGKPPVLGVNPPGPSSGATQDSIVRGFVRAGAASDAAYDNARAFLTTQMSERWKPDRTLVLLADDVAPKATLLDPATVRITARAAGTVNPQGRYTAARPGTEVTATFGLSTVGGEWRISELPEEFGRWISSSQVSRLVQPYDVHYVSTSQRSLVPDTLWFPVDKLATRLARAQVLPVPAHLEDTAVTAVPAGTRLLGDAVSIDAGVATVNLLSEEKLSAGENTRQNLWAQFVSTLTQDTGVSRVELSVNGVPVNIGGLEGPAGTLAEVGFTTPAAPAPVRPVVRRGDDVVVFDPSTLGDQEPRQPAVSGTYPQVPHTYRRLALAADGGELAAVDPGGNGISRWRGTNRYEVPLDATAVGNPSYDRRGYLWMGGVGTKGAKAPRLWVVDVAANPADPRAAAARPVQAPWLDGRRVVEARVALDGDRVAVLSTKLDGSDTRINIAGVVRTGGGLPQRLAAPLRVGTSLTRATSLAWLDDRTLAALGVLDGKAVRPVVVSVGGEVRGLTPVPNAVSIASTGGERDLWVVSSDGRLHSRAGSQWVDSGPATDLATAAG